MTSETGVTVAYNGTNYTNVTITTTTTYLGGLVFETKAYSNGTVNTGLGYTDRLQFIAHEEGRIRFKPENNTLHYDYMIKDHLGNVRMVLTEEIKSDAYTTLSFEDAQVTNQNAEWENASGASINVGGVRTASISGFNSATGNGSYVRLIKRSTGAIGATKLVKVMAGDRIHASVEYYYNTVNSTTNNSGANPLTSFVNGLTSAFGVNTQVSSLIKGDASTITTQLSGNSGFTTMINPSPNTSGSNQAPKAYLNILFFNDQFQFDAASSVVVPVPYTVNSKQTIDKKFANALTAQKNGYAYIYFSNESETLVYFDNFMFTHERGSLTEETHYYPFGLIMAGISSKAMSFGKENRRKITGKEIQAKEFSDGIGLELADFGARFFDFQIGRWTTQDCHSDNYMGWTPYNYVADNPINIVDLDGKDWFQDKNGNVIWNDSRASDINLKGIEYGNIGATLTIVANSYIHSDQDVVIGAAGDKLTNTYTIKGNYDKDGNFTGFTSTFERVVGESWGVFDGASNVDGQMNIVREIKKLSDGSYTGGFEQHTELSKYVKWLEKAAHGRSVDVTNDMRINIAKDGKVTMYIGHGTFPSVDVAVNGEKHYQFRQHSFLLSHSKFTDPKYKGYSADLVEKGRKFQAISDNVNLENRAKQSEYIKFTYFTSQPVNPKTYSNISW